MAFTLANWTCVSASLNQGQEVVNVYGVGNVTLNAPNLFLYGSPTDTLATIEAANYFLPEYASLCVGDRILVNGVDASGDLIVTSVSSTLVTTETAGSASSGLARLGVYSATYTNSGATATATIVDPNIAASSIVMARLQSSANAASVESVLPSAGGLVVTFNTAPGASVIEYIAFAPNAMLADNGVVVGSASNAGGSATFTVAAPGIVAGMTVNANFQSETNASIIQSVLPGAGTLTFVCSADPGANVVQYVGFVPTAALTEVGLYGANYTNAGGSATITISDANITAASIVSANFSAQANASVIQKVTPSAGTLTILTSANPGASVVDYIATPASSASLAVQGPYLPLAGGQMTGSILLDRGTATSTAGAATVNHQAGVITTEALTTAAASAYSFTLTNSRITASSIVFLQLMGGSNTTRGLELRAIPGAGTATISIYNNNVAGSALNGTLIFGFEVI